MKNRKLYYGNGVKYNAPDGSVITLIPHNPSQGREANILSEEELEELSPKYRIIKTILSPNAYVSTRNNS